MSAAADTVEAMLTSPFPALMSWDAVREMMECFDAERSTAFAACCIFLGADRSAMVKSLAAVGDDEATVIVRSIGDVRESAQRLAVLVEQLEARALLALAEAYEVPLDQVFPTSELEAQA